MPYSNELYIKAEKALKKRRETAETEAQERAEQIRFQFPEVDEIQRKLSSIGLEISKVLLYRENAVEKLEELKNESRALVEKRTYILKSNGFDENAMAPRYTCPHCEDRGFIGGRLCSCHKRLLSELMRAEVSRFAPLDSCTFDNFDINYYSDEPLENSVIPRVRAQKVLDASRKYAQNFSNESKNILFMGKTGLGKTHLSLAIANVVINKGYSVCYGTSQNICDDLTTERLRRDADTDYTKNQVLQSDLLIIDDLGTEIDNQYNTATLYNIINARILSKKPTIISTNYEFDELLEKYDQRITSRITGEYTNMTLFGSDIRNIKR